MFEAQFVGPSAMVLLNRRGDLYYGVFGRPDNNNNKLNASSPFASSMSPASDDPLQSGVYTRSGGADDDNSTSAGATAVAGDFVSPPDDAFEVEPPLVFFNLVYSSEIATHSSSPQDENENPVSAEDINGTGDAPKKKAPLMATCLATFPSATHDLIFIGYSDLSLRAFSLSGSKVVYQTEAPEVTLAEAAAQSLKMSMRGASPMGPTGQMSSAANGATASAAVNNGNDDEDDSGEVPCPLRFFGASPYGPFMFFAHAFGVIMVKVIVNNNGNNSNELIVKESSADTNAEATAVAPRPSIPSYTIASTHYTADEIGIGDPERGDVARLFAIVPLHKSLAALLYDTNDCFLVDFGFLRSDVSKFIVTASVLGAEDPDVAIQTSMDFAKTAVIPQVAVDTSLVLGVDAMGPLCWQIALTK